MSTLKKKIKISSIMIIGKRWIDKMYGNTYCSSRVYINGKEEFRVPWTYGYGNYYEQKAWEELEKRGYITLGKYENGVSKSKYEYLEKNKINYETTYSDGLKRDMVSWGEE